jgi:hypothetical protein
VDDAVDTEEPEAESLVINDGVEDDPEN